MNGTTTLQHLLEMAKVRGLALVQLEEWHSATNQVRVEDKNTKSEVVVRWLLSWIGWYQTYAASVLQ